MSAATDGDDDVPYEEKYDDSIGADVPSELKKRARVAAALEDKSLAQWLRERLEESTEDVDV
jgi:predicted HicB family RNase H-like nuclease